MIKATNIHKKFGQVDVLKGVDIQVDKAQVVSIVGASGAGKTTLLHILGTLDTMTKHEGSSLLINDIDVTKLSAKKLAQFRNEQIGFIFQFHYLLKDFSALENVFLPLYMNGVPKKEATCRARQLLSDVGLEKRMYHLPSQLSGGEQQRVAIARAIVNDPAILIADEPTGNLDPETSWDIMDIFKRINAAGTTIVMATHDKGIVDTMQRRVVAIEGGHIVRDEMRGGYGYED